MQDSDQTTDGEYAGPSKSQIKRDDEVLQTLGRRLIHLSKSQIAEFPVPEVLRDALLEWKRISSNEAQRRHLMRIAKLLRDLDAEAVALAMDRVDPSSSLSMSATRTAQRWSDRLLAADKDGLTEFVNLHPKVDSQRLRQLLRKAQPDVNAEKPTTAVRELMKFIRRTVITYAPPIATEKKVVEED